MNGRQEGSWDPAAVSRTVEPFWHRHQLPVCCARCGRRITKIHRDCGHLLGEDRHSPWPIGPHPLGSPLVGMKPNDAPRWTRNLGDGVRRITFICPNKRCGARITRRVDRLATEFAAAMRAGQNKLMLGQGDHELG